MTSKQIRKQFVDFFLSKGHTFVESSPVVPHDDPTLMFTNAGMNQFKPIFLGTERAKNPRVANSQKCIRAGGKHNDLDDVGQDTYHHTFFEMLGNWSFGDYFKKEAIEWAWELLTKVWGIDKSRLHATYFQGDSGEGLEPDSEAAELWRTVTDINPKHIHPGNKKDNFWEMGETGPCGPCSEVHIDLTPDRSGASLVNKGDARVMEIWNLVFIQFNRAGDGKLTPLPAKHVDTGMGFERLCSVLQGMERDRLGRFSNYDTDVFTPIFDAIRNRTKAPEYRGTLPGDDSVGSALRTFLPAQIMVDVSYRVIGDHIRTLTFALTDGATPSNEGRGYVLRRILRRAVRYGRQYLNMHEPFLCDLVEPLVNHMAEAFPELRTAHRGKNVDHVRELIRDEEASFLKTLDRGIKLFAEAADYARSHHHGKISGEDAFKLHDTYGFPIDLTELMAEEQGLTIDVGEYERLMEEAKEWSRGRGAEAPDRPSQTLIADYQQMLDEALERMREHKSRATPSERSSDEEQEQEEEEITDDSPKYLPELRCHSRLVGFGGSKGYGSIPADQLLILDRTPFYVEQGGQVSDKGLIRTSKGDFEVTHVARFGNTIAHYGRAPVGFTVDFSVRCEAIVSRDRRIPTMQNHTSTHILNWALREVLEIDGGGKVDQKGSLVDPEKTRFDFSHNKPLTDEELARIEELCNQQVSANLRVYSKEVDQKKAREISTLRAVFGEKYPDVVRVVSVGADIDEMLRDPSNAKWMKYSVEFCGGTHVANTSEIGRFVLTHEEGVAKGVRRVIGISGDKAKQAIVDGAALLGEAKKMVGGTHPTGLAEFQKRFAETEIALRTRREIQTVLTDVQKSLKEQEKLAASASGGAVMDRVAALFAEATTIGGVTVVVGEVPAAPIDALRGAIDWVRNKTSASAGSAALLASVSDGKVTLMAGMSKAVVDRGVKAGDLIKEISPLVGGKGGGRPDMAQGGGTDAGGVGKAIERARGWLAERLKSA